MEDLEDKIIKNQKLLKLKIILKKKKYLIIIMIVGKI